MTAQAYLSISPDVQQALDAGQPVVALESTIITHGMPYPQNLEMARNVEAVIRRHGAVPATIAIMDGKFCVGVSGDDLERLALEGGKAAKASRRDVSALLVTGAIAGTTVATTMQIAAMAGIKVFATGGIGGVHRGAEETFDISADLAELSRTPVAVVCAGAKSILDIAKTLEVLESNGVPVLGYGTDAFPAFWARESGHNVDHRFDDAADIARVIAHQVALGMGGVLVANPIPEADALEPAAIEARIAQAIAGTTVATTMQIAALAGIRVFATGGIGGVHRGAEATFDISADLEELSRTPVAVVCAGAKSILDIAKTLEVLETNGVPVLGYGTDEFPAFWARQSGYPVDHRFDDVADIARVIAHQVALGMGGVLVANPIPEADALDPVAIEARIAEAIAAAEAEGVSRKDLTPFLLKRIFELTEGKSLVANIALVENNARVAAQIAVALAAAAAA